MKILRSNALQGKIIDVHTHIGGVSFTNLFLNGYPTSQDIQDLLFKMDSCGVDYSVSFPFPTCIHRPGPTLIDLDIADYILKYEKFPYRFANKRLIEEISLFNISRLLPFSILSLAKSIDEQVEFIYDLAEKNPVYGIKIHTAMDGTRLSTLCGRDRLVEMLVKLDIPILVHSTFAGDVGDPNDILIFAEKYPNIRICIAHAARFNKQFYKKLLDQNNSNVYIDISPFQQLCEFVDSRLKDAPDEFLDLDYRNTKSVLEGLLSIVPNRILFGTDAPWTFVTEFSPDRKIDYTPYSYQSSINFLDLLDPEIKMKISSENTVNFIFGNEG